MYKFIKIIMISLHNVMGNYKEMKNAIISLRLRFLGIPHKEIWVSRVVLFRGLSVRAGQAYNTMRAALMAKWSDVPTLIAPYD